MGRTEPQWPAFIKSVVPPFMDTKQYHLLRVLVGSRAHKLDTAHSDYDWRGVFITPTIELLKLGGVHTQTNWIEGKEDNTTWELAHFLNMATHCNPTILETFLSPMEKFMTAETSHIDKLGEELRGLFPYVWNSNDVKNAFVGYGINQRKKFFDNKDQRAPKYATAYLRTLFNAWELLSTGTFSIDMSKTPIYETLKLYKSGVFTPGDVIQQCWEWETKVLAAFKANPDKQTNIEPVNEYLLKIRKEFWL